MKELFRTYLVWSIDHSLDQSAGIEKGIQLGVVLAKRHFQNGFAPQEFFPPQGFEEGSQGEEANPDHCPKPFIKLFEQLKPDIDDPPFSLMQLPRDPIKLKRWSRIYGFLKDKEREEYENNLIDIVTHGLEPTLVNDENMSQPGKALWFPKPRVSCPFAKWGAIATADRDEIDSLISIYTIIGKYLKDQTWKTPLSLSVFGPPGSGKSFMIEELIKALSHEAKDPLKFNLAQFTEAKDLTAAFHQAQDRALSGEVPLIFFDEFDSKLGNSKLGWLKFFLAPMQDGKFKGADGTYTIGRAIFVFAGGTSPTFAAFYKTEKKKGEQNYKDYLKFKNAKGPDFVSRLRGFLNVKGINPNEETEKTEETDEETEKTQESDDIIKFDRIKLRRAIILRSILERKAKAIIDNSTKRARISRDAVSAFLNVSNYVHGVRSMEAIVEMAQLEIDRFLVASLPTKEQLKMHVNAEEFLKIISKSSLGMV